MNWVKIIEIRSVNKKRGLLETELIKAIKEMNDNQKYDKFFIFKRVFPDTDFHIHVLHNSDKIEQEGSNLGLHLKFALKKFGLVNHSVWKVINFEKQHEINDPKCCRNFRIN